MKGIGRIGSDIVEASFRVDTDLQLAEDPQAAMLLENSLLWFVHACLRGIVPHLAFAVHPAHARIVFVRLGS